MAAKRCVLSADGVSKPRQSWIEDSGSSKTFSLSFARGKRSERVSASSPLYGGSSSGGMPSSSDRGSIRSPTFHVRVHHVASRWNSDPEEDVDDSYEDVSDVSSDVSELSELDVLIRPDAFSLRQSTPDSSINSSPSAPSRPQSATGGKRSRASDSPASSVVPVVRSSDDVGRQPDEYAGRCSKRARYDDIEAESAAPVEVSSQQAASRPAVSDPPSSALSRSSRYEQEREEKRQKWQRLRRRSLSQAPERQQHSQSAVRQQCSPLVQKKSTVASGEVGGQVAEALVYVDAQFGSSPPDHKVSSITAFADASPLSPSDVVDLKVSVTKTHVQICASETFNDWQESDRGSIPTPGAPPSRRPSEAVSCPPEEPEDYVQLVRTASAIAEERATADNVQLRGASGGPSHAGSIFSGTPSEHSIPFGPDAFEEDEISDADEEEGGSVPPPSAHTRRRLAGNSDHIDHARFRGRCDDWRPESDHVSVKTEDDEPSWMIHPCLAFFDPDAVLDLPDLQSNDVDEALGAEEDPVAINQRRLQNMLAKERGMLEEIIEMDSTSIDNRSDVEQAILNSVVHWILAFETHLVQYPPTPPSTRFRAVYLFSTFFRLRHFPTTTTGFKKQKHARLLGVASYFLALKTDVDFNSPLFVVPSRQLAQNITMNGWVPVNPQDVVVFEKVLLEALSHHTTLCTPFDFMEDLCQCVPSLLELADECPDVWQDLMEGWTDLVLVCLKDHDFIKFRPSTLTATALILHLEDSLFNPNETPSSSDAPSRASSTSTSPPRQLLVSGRRLDDEVQMWSQVNESTIVRLERWTITQEICGALSLPADELESCRYWFGS